MSSILGMLGGGIGSSLLTIFFMRDKTKADTENIHAEIVLTINKAALEQIESFRKDVLDLRDENRLLREENETLRVAVAELRDEMQILLDQIGKYQRSVPAHLL